MAEINPYQAPRAAVADVQAAESGLAAEPNAVDAGRGLVWLTQGWAIFRQAPLIWVAICVIGIVVFALLAWIPIIGQLATTFLSILFAGGVMLGCRALDRGEELTLAHLFAGFQSHRSPLLVIGALYLAGLFVLIVAVSLITGGTAFAFVRGGFDVGTAFTSILLALLAVGLVIVPLAMAIWFAPGLATLNDVPPVEAMKRSFRGCLRNVLAFLVYGVLGFMLALLATLPAGLGWLVLLPVLAGSTYAAYKEIFLQH
ncbi:MAG: hypothetical protein IT531_14410 [Burkholderiales bacterium]|nr:hypothetical protein [Burkholderiales bacterium]